MSILSLFRSRNDFRVVDEADGVVVEQVKRNGTPEPGEVLMLDVAPTDPLRLPARYEATVVAVKLGKILLGPLQSLVPGNHQNVQLSKLGVITVTFARGTSVFRFEGTPVAVGRNWALQRPRKVQRIERRGYFRMMLESPTVYRLENGAADGRMPGCIGNISAGGLLLETSVPLAKGQRIRVSVPTGKAGVPVDVAADVLEAFARVERGKTVHLSRARFVTGGSQAVHIDTREEIVAYIFEQQRHMLRVRKLMTR